MDRYKKDLVFILIICIVRYNMKEQMPIYSPKTPPERKSILMGDFKIFENC